MAFPDSSTWEGGIFTGRWAEGAAGAGEVREPATSAGECGESAALTSAPCGELLPDGARVSLQRRVPAGVVGVVSPFNFPPLLSSARDDDRWPRRFTVRAESARYPFCFPREVTDVR